MRISDMGDRVVGLHSDHTNWYTVVDWIKYRKCDSYRKVGFCGCKKRNGQVRYNPCELVDDLEQSAEAMAIDREPKVSLETMLAWAKRRPCNEYQQTGHCNHPRCSDAQVIIDFITAELTASRRKAA